MEDYQIQTPFIHLRSHSAYSLSEGAIKIEELVGLCKANQMPALALTDTNNMSGALEFSLACTNHQIKPIMGIEVKIGLDGGGLSLLPSMVLLAETDTGYKNLLKLISRVYDELLIRKTPHVTLDDLKEYGEGVIALSGGADGPIGHLLLSNKKELAEKILLQLKDIFPRSFFMELGRHGEEKELKTEDIFLEWAYQFSIPLVATNNIFFSDPTMHEAHDALLCIADGKYISDTERRCVTPHHFFKSCHEMKVLFKDLPEAIENTYYIAQRCQVVAKSSKPVLPKFSTFLERSEEEELRIQATDGLKKRLGNKILTVSEDDYTKRLNTELDIIIKMGFAGYFLIVADFIQWAKNNNIPVGPGRGSGAGSVVAWALTITDLDPIRFGLFFERFLNPERISMPDFDVDFCQDRRDEVIHYVQQKYGKDRVAHIITFGKLQARAVIRDVGRVLQMPYPQVDKICKLIPQNPSNPYTLDQAIQEESALQEMIDTDSLVAKVVEIGRKLEGLYRHASTHAAGLIIGDRPLHEVVPLYRDSKSDILATQFSMKYVELAGLVKFDFLGLKTLTVIQKALEMIQDQGYTINMADIPFDDQKTFNMLNQAQTVGIFQLEGQGMRDVVRKLCIDKFEEIIALGALYRPGPMDDIPRFIACKHGEQEVYYDHPLLEPILKETYGVIVYQEQAMQIAQVLAGYSMGSADILRRAMGKKIKSEMDAQRKIFINGAQEKNVDPTVAAHIFDQIAKFASYAFPKAHAAPYGLITYYTAYLKANFPHEFMAATMTYDAHNTDKLSIYYQELKSLGIELLPPDINQSLEDFSVEIDHENQKKYVRYALTAIKNVGEASMKALVEERQNNGKFKSLEDFLSRLHGKILSKRQLESLICAGALDSLHANRRHLWDGLEQILKYVQDLTAELDTSQTQLFSLDTVTSQKLQFPSTLDWDIVEKLKYESDAIGFYLSNHPLKAYGETILKQLKVIKSTDINGINTPYATMVGMPSAFKQRISKSGRKFAFLSLSDDQGSYETMLFSELILTASPLIESGKPLLLSVTIRTDESGVKKLTAQKISSLETAVESLTQEVCMEIKNSSVLSRLKDFLHTRNGGKTKIYLIIQTDETKAKIQLPGLYKITPADVVLLDTLSQI